MIQLDEMRTTWHSQIIRNMSIIDNVSKTRGLPKVFDYAEEFENCISKLTPNVKDKKAKANMTERERIKRRELGNFGLYIAASVTVGLDMSDREMRDFASCEDDNVYKRSDNMREAYYNVQDRLKKLGTKKVTRNMNDMVK